VPETLSAGAVKNVFPEPLPLPETSQAREEHGLELAPGDPIPSVWKMWSPNPGTQSVRKWDSGPFLDRKSL